jgi:hypothetical protein
MNSQSEQVLIEKLKALPPERRAEVEDFIDFLQGREDDQRLTRSAARASEGPSRPCGITRMMPNTIGCNRL